MAINSPLLSQLTATKSTKSAGIEPSSSSGAVGRGPLGSRENPWHWWDAKSAKPGDYVYERPASSGIGQGRAGVTDQYDPQRFMNMDNLAASMSSDGPGTYVPSGGRPYQPAPVAPSQVEPVAPVLMPKPGQSMQYGAQPTGPLGSFGQLPKPPGWRR